VTNPLGLSFRGSLVFSLWRPRLSSSQILAA
jgi:hypothetical protein